MHSYGTYFKIGIWGGVIFLALDYLTGMIEKKTGADIPGIGEDN